jgi:hypothetical protein
MEGKQKHGEFSVITRLPVGDWWIGPWGLWEVSTVTPSQGHGMSGRFMRCAEEKGRTESQSTHSGIAWRMGKDSNRIG